jgi:hypothetical protein
MKTHKGCQRTTRNLSYDSRFLLFMRRTNLLSNTFASETRLALCIEVVVWHHENKQETVVRSFQCLVVCLFFEFHVLNQSAL